MKAIVVRVVRTRDVKLPTGDPRPVMINGNSQAVVISRADKTNRADKPSPNHNEWVPPFWTWFIENPRPRSSRSSRSLADSTFGP